MLGEVLIQSLKNLHKGAGFKLYKDFKKTHKEFKALKEILKEFKEPSINTLKGISDNKELFLKEYERIKELLKTHQNYPAILDNIFYNFSYFIQNFNLIKEWLLSSDFNQRYKKENHPYPSLLNPKKLNDENEEINYKNIPAKLAWDMNLPLPENYEFVFLFNACSGSEAIQHFFYLCDVETRAWTWYSANEIFALNYDFILSSLISAPCIPNITSKNYHLLGNYEKIFFLLSKKCDIFFIVRDPISIMKTALNHIDNLFAWNNFQSSRLYGKITYKNYSFNDLFPKILYAYSNSYRVNVEDIAKCLENSETYFTLNKRISMLKYNIKDIVCINFEDINSKNIFNTLSKLSEKFSFKKPIEKYRFIFEKRVNMYEGLLHLPVIIDIFGIEVIITTPYLFSLDKTNIDKYKNITKYFFESDFILDNVMVICSENKINDILENEKWIEFKDYVIWYIKSLKQYIENVKANLISEKDILFYLKKHKRLAFELKKYINENIAYVKKNHKEYIKTWKYYQEFEKMCQELEDGS